MATFSPARLQKITKAFNELEEATGNYNKALAKFAKTYDPKTVGIDQMCDTLGDFLFDIDQEIQDQE